MPKFFLLTVPLLWLTSIAAAQELEVPALETPAGVVETTAQVVAPAQQPADSATPLLEIPTGFAAVGSITDSNALLLEIASAQFAAKDSSLVAGIRLKLYLKEREDGHASEVGFALVYRLHPREIIRLEIEDAERGTSVQKGFDGSDYWLTEDGKEKQILSGHEFGKDRESIEDAMDLCSDLMLMLDFRQLEKRNMPRAVLQHQDGRRILVGDIKRREGSKWRYHLWLSKDNLQPHRLELARAVETKETAALVPPESALETQPGAPPTTTIEYQRFELMAYEAFDGRFIPRLVEMFPTPFSSDADLPARILQIHQFEWVAN